MMHAAGRGTLPALVQRPLVRHWYSYLPTLPGLKNYRLSHFPPLPGYQEVQPLAVNRHHQMVGFYRGGGAGAYLVILARPFSYQRGRLHFLPTLPEDTITHPVDINDEGEIVGDAALGSFPGDENVPSHAVCWVRGKVHDLGTGAASSINNAGDVVGDSGTGPAISSHPAYALLWTHGYRFDLNNCLPPHSGWILTTATAIDGKGRITGYGLFHGKERAFLLTPISR